MGRIPARCSACLDDYAVTRFFRLFVRNLFLCLLMLSASSSFAGFAQLKPPPSVGGSVGARTTAGQVSANDGQFSQGMTTSVAGTLVTVPATWSFAANAGQFAVAAVRSSPASLIGGAVAAWLLAKGLSYLDGQFQKTDDSSQSQYGGGYMYQCAGSPPGPISVSAATACGVAAGHEGITGVAIVNVGGIWMGTASTSGNPGAISTIAVFSPVGGCPEGTTDDGSKCVATSKKPATQADFDQLTTAPLPDAVTKELTGKGVSLPLNDPALDPKPQVVPLSSPHPDPSSPGVTVRDIATVTPQTSERVQIEVSKQPVDSVTGQPKTDPTTGDPAPTEEKTEFCVENPDVLACAKFGEPEEVEELKKTKDISITPDSGFGPADSSCPAPLTYSLINGGRSLSFSYEPICKGARIFRPAIIGMAWLSGLFIFFGFARKGT